MPIDTTQFLSIFKAAKISADGSKAINAEVGKLEPDAIVELFVLDASEVGGSAMFFHAGTNQVTDVIVYQGIPYVPLPVEVKGFTFNGKGELPRPHITFSALGGGIRALVLLYDDLVGATVIRRRVHARYLDGQPSADPACHYPDDIYTIDRKVNENRYTVEFELGTAFEVQGIMLPGRQVLADLCPFQYRGDGCGFAERFCVADSYDNPIGELKKYAGDWDEKTNYVNGQCASESVDYSGAIYNTIYKALVDSLNKRPSQNPTYWKTLQIYKGAYDATKTYSKGDVVRISSRRGFFILFYALKTVPPGNTPPDKNYWQSDVCSRKVSGCKLRYDPLSINLPLNFGGFPGTSRIPEL